MSIRNLTGLNAIVSVFVVALVLVLSAGAGAQSTSVRPPDDAQIWGKAGQVPSTIMPQPSDSAMWRKIRRGVSGTVSIPDKKAGVLVQSDGEAWRAVRNGPISVWGGWGLLAVLVVLALFFAVRGRIRIDAGPGKGMVERFNAMDRFAHWLMAGSFVVLGLTGLNMLYGRYVLKPILGADGFAWLTMMGKYAHDYLAFAFMIGLVMAFVLWVRQNLPTKADLVWLAKGGGMLTKGVHPPANKFNAGQKILFWIVVLGGVSISLTGLSLLFPFSIEMFGSAFAVFNIFGLGLETNLTGMQEMQLAQIWHAVVGLVMIVVIIAHIYIGTLGMEGAFDAMGTGMVDENWAKEHHNLWVEELGSGKKSS